MKNFIHKIKELYDKYYGSYITSVVGTGFMLSLSLISFIYTKLNFYIIFIIFYAFIILIRTVNFIIRKKNNFDDYSRAACINPTVTGSSMIISNAVFVISLLSIINAKPLLKFPFDWLIYGYAAYAFWKLGLSIYHLIKGLGKKNNCILSLSAIEIDSALFTLLTLAVNLLGTFATDSSADLSPVIEYLMVSVSGLINIAFAIYLLVLGIKKAKQIKAEKNSL